MAIVTHGGIDGFSRTIVYLRCSTNNQASTVMASFADAVSKYGLPEQVRSDRGGENVAVWQYMLEQHHSESAVLVGSSTHNERIERMWRDVYRCVGVIFADLFREMEGERNVSCFNQVDLFCLHSVFLPRINNALNSFVESWNNHPLSSERNLTPNQLFIEGALRQNMTPALPSPSPTTDGTACPGSHAPVHIPRSSFCPCDHLLHQIERYDMLRTTTDFGYSIYLQVCQIVGDHICLCNDCC